MTRDEAHRRAIEAAKAEFFKAHPGMQFTATVEAMVNAYLAAMVLPISESPTDGTPILCGKKVIWWEREWPDGACFTDGHSVCYPETFTFLPGPPK